MRVLGIILTLVGVGLGVGGAFMAVDAKIGRYFVIGLAGFFVCLIAGVTWIALALILEYLRRTMNAVEATRPGEV